MLGMSKLFHGRSRIMIHSSRMKEVTRNINVWKAIPTVSDIWDHPILSRDVWLREAGEPAGAPTPKDQMWRGREVGHVWQSGLSVSPDKSSWLIWRLPTPPRLTGSLHDLHSRESMGCSWRLYLTLEVSIWNTHILRRSKSQLPRSILKISEKRTLTIQARATQEQPKAFWDGVWRDRSSKEKAQLLLDLIRVSFGLGGRHKNHELEMSGALAHASWCFTKSLLVEVKPFIFLKPRLF